VQWQVLVAWKGNHRSGDTFTTRQTLDVTPGGCHSLLYFQGLEPNLLYLFDKEPYAEFNALPPGLAADDLKHLERQRNADADGT
jgi:hypothetical protein